MIHERETQKNPPKKTTTTTTVTTYTENNKGVKSYSKRVRAT